MNTLYSPHTHTQTHTHTHTYIYWEKERVKHRGTERRRETETDIYNERKIEIETEILKDAERDRGWYIHLCALRNWTIDERCRERTDERERINKREK